MMSVLWRAIGNRPYGVMAVSWIRKDYIGVYIFILRYGGAGYNAGYDGGGWACV